MLRLLVLVTVFLTASAGFAKPISESELAEFVVLQVNTHATFSDFITGSGLSEKSRGEFMALLKKQGLESARMPTMSVGREGEIHVSRPFMPSLKVRLRAQPKPRFQIADRVIETSGKSAEAIVKDVLSAMTGKRAARIDRWHELFVAPADAWVLLVAPVAIAAAGSLGFEQYLLCRDGEGGRDDFPIGRCLLRSDTDMIALAKRQGAYTECDCRPGGSVVVRKAAATIEARVNSQGVFNQLVFSSAIDFGTAETCAVDIQRGRLTRSTRLCSPDANQELTASSVYNIPFERLLRCCGDDSCRRAVGCRAPESGAPAARAPVNGSAGTADN